MRHLFFAIAMLLTVGLVAAQAGEAKKAAEPAKAAATTAAATTAPAAPTAHDVANIKQHLKEHQKYPATKEQLVAECFNLKDFSESDKAWFTSKLAAGTYKSADEVVAALGLK